VSGIYFSLSRQPLLISTLVPISSESIERGVARREEGIMVIDYTEAGRWLMEKIHRSLDLPINISSNYPVNTDVSTKYLYYPTI
jgi:hypothetical protein